MALLIKTLATQLLEQTRLLSNAPILERNEPLRVEIIPGGASGGQLTDGLLSLAGPISLEALRLKISYEIWRKGAPLASGDFIRLPAVVSEDVDQDQGPLTDLLSAAFLVKPTVKLVKGKKPADVLPSLPELDHQLLVTLTIHSSATILNPEPSRTIEIPFTVPAVEVNLPIPPAICICASNPNLTPEDGKFLVMLPPGSPDAVPQIIEAYNGLMDSLNTLKALPGLDGLGSILAPLELAVSTLSKIPTPYISTNNWVKDFDDYDDFDDEMTSLLLVAPSGWGVQFSDTANIGDWDDTGGHCFKTYTAIDLLQLPTHPHGSYLMDKLNLDPGVLSALADAVGTLTGVSGANAKLGIGVFHVHDLTSSSTPGALQHYDNSPGDEVNDDTESARWTGNGED